MMALHGFLGRPQDWDGVGCALLREANTPDWTPLFRRGSTAGSRLDGVASVLNADGGGVLIGYSMGGRIALHMLLDDESHGRWEKAVIVSSSPGITDGLQRPGRVEHDRHWAERFLSEPWDSVVRDWNCQEVFANEPNSPAFARSEQDFDRQELALSLIHGSVGVQADLRERLRGLRIPVLWIAGERDEKYRDLAFECAALNPLFQCQIPPNAGHRAPWSNPRAFCEALNSYLSG